MYKANTQHRAECVDLHGKRIAALPMYQASLIIFKIPAEIFPTRYRCSCYGISAAFGKFGSVIAQVSLVNIQFNALDNCQHTADTNLGKVLIG